jgi:hypothetical protein
MKEVTWLMAIDDDLAEGFLQHNQLTQKFGTHRWQGIVDRMAKASTYTVSIWTGTRAPAYLDQADVSLYDREPGFEIMERRRCAR